MCKFHLRRLLSVHLSSKHNRSRDSGNFRWKRVASARLEVDWFHQLHRHSGSKLHFPWHGIWYHSPKQHQFAQNCGLLILTLVSHTPHYNLNNKLKPTKPFCPTSFAQTVNCIIKKCLILNYIIKVAPIRLINLSFCKELTTLIVLLQWQFWIEVQCFTIIIFYVIRFVLELNKIRQQMLWDLS